MPPSFAPKERRKKRDTSPPSEPKSVDDIVKAIEREYREEMRKRGLVDNWGQPIKNLDKKRLKQDVQKELEKEEKQEKRAIKKKAKRSLSKSMAASLSEAIGKRYREDESKRKSSDKPSESKEKSATREEKHASSKESRTPRERKERLGPKVNMRCPEVRGEKITSKGRLKEIIDGEYSALKRKKDFPRRMKEAEAHLDLLEKYEGQERLKYGDITKVAKESGVERQTVGNWLSQRKIPRLYTYMELATPKSEAREKVRYILEANKRVDGMKEIERRLENYYFKNAEQSAASYQREVKNAQRYFDFLKRYEEGGHVNEIAQLSGLSDSGAREYLNGRRPWLVRLASQIPSEQAKPGKVWLPTETTGWGIRKKFIEIPREIESYNDVLEVLGQLQPLNVPKMQEGHSKYGDVSKADAFMYVLGIFVSDSGVQNQSGTTQSMILPLSKSYDWSKDVGYATCYYMGLLGIRTWRAADQKGGADIMQTKNGPREISREDKHVWKSEACTTLRWVWNSALGLQEGAKRDQAIDAKWILSSPRHMRVSFVQGLGDGDGSASPRGRYLCITTKRNQEFVQALMKSLDVETRITGTDVVTKGYENAKRAARIPIFRFSSKRLNASEKVVRMIDATRDVKKDPLKQEEISYIISLRKRGLSWYDIHEAVFDKFQTCIDRRTIKNAVMRGESYSS